MGRYVLFNKPFQVLTQFTDDKGRKTLKDFIDIPDIYSAGRLDYDSEGLLLLTDDGALIHQMMNPRHKVPKTYSVQVENIPKKADLEKLSKGIELKDGPTLPSQINRIEQPDWLWPRNPPVRERKSIPDCWLSITIKEGRNRQVRRMTAAIGCPTLRLIRTQIGNIHLNDLPPGDAIEVNEQFLKDNGIKWNPKKSSPKAARRVNSTKLSGSHQPRNRHFRNRNQKA